MAKEQKRKFKGIWIPSEVVKKLPWRQAILLSAFYFDAPLTHKDIKYLFDKKLLVRGRMSVSGICELLKSKNLHGHGIGKMVCEWCKINTITLQKHHYPIPQSQNGKKVVKICANCHQEFHSILSKENFFIKDRELTKMYE